MLVARGCRPPVEAGRIAEPYGSYLLEARTLGAER